MSKPSLHERSDVSAEFHLPDHAQAEGPSAGVRVTVIVQNRFTFDTDRVTGRQIKQTAAVPAGFALYRRAQSGNEPIADDISANPPEGGRVLEVGCGPGHLSILLARRHGLEVRGLDLDPAMIERARAQRLQ